MRVLLITNRVPFPANSGYPIVIHNTIKGLIDEGASVCLFSLNPDETLTRIAHLDDPLIEKIQFVPARLVNRVSTWKVIVSLFARQSWHISRFYNSEPVARLKQLLCTSEFDVVQIEGLFVLPYLNVVRQNSKAKVVYREHNIEHLISGSSATSEVSAVRRFYLKLMARRMLRFELDNLNRTDAVLTINSADQSHLVSAGCTVRIDNFPVSIDPESYVPDPSLVEYPSIFHIGTLNSFPAADGLRWFIDEVWNDLESLDAGLKFYIAGRDIPEDLYRNESNHFIIHDDIDDPKAFINSKQVMIVPLRTGSGMRVKIIEAMAMKKCVISTSLGAEGINYQHGKNILIADNPGEFYQNILRSVTDKRFCEEIGEQARRLVEKEYNIRRNSGRLLAFYREIAC
jgi:glycosyltransferase involved in cell wall biosynthesis